MPTPVSVSGVLSETLFISEFVPSYIPKFASSLGTLFIPSFVSALGESEEVRKKGVFEIFWQKQKDHSRNRDLSASAY